MFQFSCHLLGVPKFLLS